MTTADHTPSRGCYQRGCRHPKCELANYRYSKQLELEHARGEHRLHDITQVRAHIQQLLANNWWLAEIARASGRSSSSIRKIYTSQLQTHKDTALAILSLPITPILRSDRGDRTRALGSTRRLQALAYLGHPYGDISEETGIAADRLRIITRGLTDVVRPDEACKIAAAYRVLSTKPGRLKQIATAARNKGWHGPLAWDDIDDPHEQPEIAKPFESSKKYVQDPDKKAEIEHLYLLGESVPSIAKQLGGNEKYIADQLAAILREREQRAQQERAAARLRITRQHLPQAPIHHPEDLKEAA